MCDLYLSSDKDFCWTLALPEVSNYSRSIVSVSDYASFEKLPVAKCVLPPESPRRETLRRLSNCVNYIFDEDFRWTLVLPEVSNYSQSIVSVSGLCVFEKLPVAKCVHTSESPRRATLRRLKFILYCPPSLYSDGDAGYSNRQNYAPVPQLKNPHFSLHSKKYCRLFQLSQKQIASTISSSFKGLP